MNRDDPAIPAEDRAAYLESARRRLALDARFTSIGGGTDQIRRNIIGERGLRLPREPDVDRTIPFRHGRSG